MSNVIDKFLRYTKIDTRSDPDSNTVPTTPGQWDLLRLLEQEVKDLGLEVSLDDKGYLMAKLPANTDKPITKLGFLAHVDTSPDFSGKGVQPKITRYKGGDLVLNEQENIVMPLADFPNLGQYVDQELIHSDGTTLLGADNKAGIAEIMTAVEYLVQHPEIEHGDISIAFTPDEEVGRGADFFDVEKFGAELAYTIDGGPLGELEYENFNAAEAVLMVKGRNVHPGTAKDKMINAISLAMEWADALPKDQVPEKTEGYQGFYLLMGFEGTVEEAKLKMIIRDHDSDEFDAKKQFLKDLTEDFNQEYDGRFELTLRDQYQNMKEQIKPVMHMIDHARQAMLDCGVDPLVKAIRGGTDGARLSFMGLPCPNIFSGGENYHGRFEFIPIASMEKAVEVILRLIQIYREQADR
jgi:tripeptide aminopeptidase